MKSVSTVIDDIHSMLESIIEGKAYLPEGSDEDENNLTPEQRDAFRLFKENVSASILRQFTPRTKPRKEKVIYYSELGRRCSRELWYDHNGGEKEPITPDNLIKFMYGDILEEFLVLLVRLSGHEVTHEQERVTVELHDGWVLSGRIDFKIDGTLIDAKSASTYAFKKFKDKTLPNDDPFGYMAQLSGYAQEVSSVEHPGFLAIDKQHGTLTMYQPSRDELEASIADTQIMIDIIESVSPPPRDFDDVVYGKSGNNSLCMECSFCKYKKECWKDANGGEGLRSFQYADGKIIHLTKITKEPRLTEIN